MSETEEVPPNAMERLVQKLKTENERLLARNKELLSACEDAQIFFVAITSKSPAFLQDAIRGSK